MTGNSLLAECRLRLNDEGDDTQLADGTANAQYFWSDTELLYYLNAAKNDLFRALVNLKKSNELKNLVATTTATTVPANCFAPFAATVDGEHALLFDEPRTYAYRYLGNTKTVLVTGNAIQRVGGAAHVLWYYKRPADIVASGTTITEMTQLFYETCVAIAVQDATHKDNAQSRIVLRRTFGNEDIQYVEAQKKLGMMT